MDRTFYRIGITILVPYLLLLNNFVGASNNNGTDTNSIINKNSLYKPFTSQEKIAIAKFREAVTPILYQDYMKMDTYLIRWIREANFNLDTAKEKLTKAINWRKENNIDSILKEDFSTFSRTCPYHLRGHDTDGRPIVTFGLASCDLRKAVIAGDISKFERYTGSILERCISAVNDLQKSGKDIREGVAIMDVGGFNLRQHGCFRCVPAIISVLISYMNYYPDYLHQLYFINFPRIANPLLDVLLQVASPKMKSLLKVYGFDRNEWEAEIRKSINPNQLPYQYGGEKKRKQ